MKTRQLPLFLLAFFLFSNTIHAQTSEGVRVAVKVFLQGALMDTPSDRSLMRDDLRRADLIPVDEPYGNGGSITDLTLFDVEEENALVDWVSIELRTPSSPSSFVAARSALLQRDGDVVDLDGTSPVFFEGVELGEYYVVVRHRNHLGIATQGPILMGSDAKSIDFSDPGFPVFGEHVRVQVGEAMAMWAGDINQDGRSIYQGPNNDTFFLFSHVMGADANTSLNLNHISVGYFTSDINLDGKAIYSGHGSDRGKMFIQVFSPAAILFGLSGRFEEQIP